MRIAVVDDDLQQTQWLARLGEDMGYCCETFAEAAPLLQPRMRSGFDLLLLDWQLPGMSGVELARQLRREGERMPIMMITHRSDERDIVAALLAGADDFIAKPVRPGELKARLLALLRRSYPQQNAPQRVGRFSWQIASRTFYVDDEAVDLKPREFDLALCMFQKLGRLLSREYLMNRVWGLETGLATRTVDTHISAIRSKLRLRPENGVRLSSVYGHGYRLEEIDTSDSNTASNA